jgi:hypothetical protein
MTLTERFFEMTADVREQAADYAQRAAETAREGAERAATRVDAAKSPVETLADAGHALNDLAHAYVGRVVALQARLTHAGIAGAAARLRMLANASSLRGAYAQQVDAFDGTRDRVTRDATEALDIVVDAGRGVSELALRTYAQLISTPRVRAARKPAGRGKARVRTAARKARGSRKAA